MQVVNKEIIQGKKVLLRLDIDVPIELGVGSSEFVVKEDFRLKAGLPTLKLCLENSAKVIIIGHLGRPFATAAEEKNGPPQDLRLEPVFKWFKSKFAGIEFAKDLIQAQQSAAKLILLENVRFFHGEVPGADYHESCTSKTCDVDFAKQLASLGEVFINEAFASYNLGASTTILPTLLPHAAGLRFAEEVKVLKEVRDHPKKPFVAVMGGAKVKDKLPVIEVLAKQADVVLVGGKLVDEIREQNLQLPKNVMVGKLNEDGFDIAAETTDAWSSLLSKAAMIVWNGPVGKFEDPKNDQSAKLAELVLRTEAKVVTGGGDTISLLGSIGLLEEYEQKGFVSTGGGAMLKLLANGTLPTIQALN